MMSRSRRLSSVISIFSYTLSRRVSSMTLHSPSSTDQTLERLLMPCAHLYVSKGGTSESDGLIQAGKRRRWSAWYHRYWSRYASVIFSMGSMSYTGLIDV